MPHRKKSTHGSQRIDFRTNTEAQEWAWIIKGLLEEYGYTGRKQWFMLTQMAYESGGFNSPVAIANNNYNGITWFKDKGFLNLPGYKKGTPRPKSEGGNYTDFPTVEDDICTYIAHYVTRDKIGQGAPIDARTIPEFAKKLYYDKYATDDEVKYTGYLLDWFKELQNYGLIPTDEALTNAAWDKTYDAKGFMHRLSGPGGTCKSLHPVPGVDSNGNYLSVALSKPVIQPAIKQAPGKAKLADLAKQLNDITHNGLSRLRPPKRSSYITDVVNPIYLELKKELDTAQINTAVMPVDSAFRRKAYEDLDKKASTQKKQANSSYNTATWGYRYVPFMSRWQIPSRDNGLPPEFQWLQNGFQNPAIAVDTSAASIHVPVHKAATRHHEAHKPAKGSDADQRHSSAITPGDGRQIVINMNAPMYQVDSQVFQNNKDAIQDFEPKVRTALMHILDNARGA